MAGGGMNTKLWAPIIRIALCAFLSVSMYEKLMAVMGLMVLETFYAAGVGAKLFGIIPLRFDYTFIGGNI